jgi:hypothetical protein
MDGCILDVAPRRVFRPKMQDQGDHSDDDLTAFKTTQFSLRKSLEAAHVDPAEFQRKITRCSLSKCRGMCCYDGASVDKDTGDAIQDLATKRASEFRAMGLNLPKAVVVDAEWKGVTGRKTATRPFPYRSLVEDYPAHFNETACVFLLNDGRCGLQILSEGDGKHPWYYKPFTCWLQPIKLSDSAIRLYDETTDPNKLPGYNGFVIRTFCGRTEECGQLATEVLKEEMGFLGKLLNRDLLAEIQPLAKPTEDPKSE